MTLIAIISLKSEVELSNGNPIKAIRANSPRNLEDGLLYFFKKEENPKYNSTKTLNSQDDEIIDDYYQTELDMNHWNYSFLDKLDLQKITILLKKKFFYLNTISNYTIYKRPIT